MSPGEAVALVAATVVVVVVVAVILVHWLDPQL